MGLNCAWLCFLLFLTINNSAQAMVKKDTQKRYQVRSACGNCRKKHAGCDSNRPCTTCKKRDLADTCRDEPTKRQRQERKTTPYDHLQGFLPLEEILPTPQPSTQEQAENILKIDACALQITTLEEELPPLNTGFFSASGDDYANDLPPCKKKKLNPVDKKNKDSEQNFEHDFESVYLLGNTPVLLPKPTKEPVLTAQSLIQLLATALPLDTSVNPALISVSAIITPPQPNFGYENLVPSSEPSSTIKNEQHVLQDYFEENHDILSDKFFQEITDDLPDYQDDI